MGKILKSVGCSLLIALLLRDLLRAQLHYSDWFVDSIVKYIFDCLVLFIFVYVIHYIKKKIIEWNEKRGVKTQDNHQ